MTSDIDCGFFSTLPAATLLFQPPVERVTLAHTCGDHLQYKDSITIFRPLGITFGAVVEELNELHPGVGRDDASLYAVVRQFYRSGQAMGRDGTSQTEHRGNIQSNHSVNLTADGAVDSASSYVRVAREAKICEEENVPWAWNQEIFENLTLGDDGRWYTADGQRATMVPF